MDGGIEGHLVAAPGVVAWQAGFVAGLTRDVAAGEEEIGDNVHVGVGDDAAAGCLDRFERRLGREHGEDVEWREDAALVGPVGVDVDDERRTSGAVAGGGDGGDDGGDAAGVVPMPVRQEQHVDAGQVDRQPFGVGEPDIAVGADVEQHRCRAVALSCCGERGEAVAGDAELVEGDDTVVTIVLASGRDAPEQVGDFGELRHAWGDAREGVGGVVDDDRDGELVEVRRARERCHGSIVPEPAPTGSLSTSASVSSVVWPRSIEGAPSCGGVGAGASWSPNR